VVFKLSKATTLDTRIQGRFERYNGPYISASDIFEEVMDANPVDYPAVWRPDAANRYTRNVLFGTAAGAPDNAYAQMVRGYENRDETTITAQATLSHDFSRWVEGLKFQLKGSANVWNYYSAKRSYNPYYYALLNSNPNTGDYTLYCTNPENESAMLGDVEASRNSSGHYYFEARLNWDHKFGAHTLGFMTVGMMEEYVLTAGSSSSIFETLPERNLGNSGRFTYDYDERYFLEFAYGYNGSEKFANKHRYGFFPSIGAGWLVSNEAFWDRLKTPVPTAKLKFTYGLVGNDAIAGRSGRFFYLSNISLQSSTSDNTVAWGKAYNNRHGSYSITRYGNDDISWEVSTKLNVGFELGLMKGEPLKIQADWFTDVRNKIYMNRANLPSSAGFSAQIDGNIGKVKSQGFDASADYQHFFNNDFWLMGRGNFTYATNKYLTLDEPNYKYGYLSKVGQNINQQWGYVAERLFVDNAEIANSPSQTFGLYQPGDIKYKDVNGDGIVDSDDQIPMGFPTMPEIQYGYGLSAGYKNFDFSFFFQGNARVSFFINSQAIAPFSNHRNALKIVADDYWQETDPNEHAFWPRLSVSPLENNTQQSSWWLRDGKFMRLKTLEVGYTLPDMTKLGIKTCRAYFSGENLFVVSPFKMWDPEMGNNGLAYPINRRFNAGVQVSF
jgi:TonB-linked SusC/RagA family outer membrane protein